jgi:hypothetical protein
MAAPIHWSFGSRVTGIRNASRVKFHRHMSYIELGHDEAVRGLSKTGAGLPVILPVRSDAHFIYEAIYCKRKGTLEIQGGHDGIRTRLVTHNL